MQLNYFLQVVLDEITAEGLEGITFECLWIYLSDHQYFKCIDEKFKEYLWNFIRNLSQINFYQLKEARNSNLKMQNRIFTYKYDRDCYIEDELSMFQIHSYNIVNLPNVFGSCCTYATRKLIDNDIKTDKNMNYANLIKKYGNTLVLVANQETRLKFLGIDKCIEFISKSTYALLELIGRSRSFGIKATGTHSALEFLKDSSVLWYCKKKLKSINIIRIQKLNFFQSNTTIKESSIFQLNRFYRPLYNVFEADIEKFLLFMDTICASGLLKSIFLETLELSEDFLKRAKALGFVEIIMATYRNLNKSCDIDQFQTDKGMLQMYISDFRLSKTESHPLQLIDKRSCFIKPIKTLLQLKERMEQRTRLFETDEDPLPDVLLTNNLVGINIEEPLHIQVLKLLAHTPMSASEIKNSLGLKKKGIKGVIKHLIRNDQIVIRFKVIDRNSVPFYTIRQSLTNVVQQPSEMNIKEPLDIDEQVPIEQFIKPADVTSEIRNPKRRDRYNYIVEVMKREVIITGHMVMQKLIRDWETSKNLTERMDRKSYNRIIDDAIKNKIVKVIEVDLEIGKKSVKEKWLIQPGTTRDSPLFQEHINKRLEQFPNRDKNVDVVVKKKPKKRKHGIDAFNNFCDINIIKEVKNIVWQDELGNIKLPELPIMMRRKLLHEFIWYISIGSHFEPNINIKSQFDQYGFRVFVDTLDWKRHVAPLQQDTDDKFISFNINDLLLRMPISLFCMIVLPKICNKELSDCLADENLKWATLENLVRHHITVVSFLLNSFKKLGLRKLFNLIESLINMGLVTKYERTPPIRYKEDAMFYLNREVFLTDTSKIRLPVSDEIIWMKLPRYQWLLDSKINVINYWENVYNVCTNTQCDTTYRHHGLQIMGNYSQDDTRNSDYISKMVNGNGPVAIENAENLNQLGCWLPPIGHIKWKNLGPGGYYLSISSWCILAWCQNKFDKQCNQIIYSLSSLFSQFRNTLFTEAIKNLSSYVYISSLNESLSLILNEVNIILTAAAIMRYEDSLEKFWGKIRLKKWLKASFLNIRYLNIHALTRYMSLLTIEHENERNFLIQESMKFPTIELFTKIVDIKEYRERNAVKEAVVIRALLLNLIKVHRFIPQWDTLNTKNYTIDSDETKTNSQLIDVLNIKSNVEVNKKIIYPDKTSTTCDISLLTISKYMLGCMYGCNEYNTPNITMRNKILGKYSKDWVLNVINGFKNFYVLEPLKANKSKWELIESGSLDNRLSKFAVRLCNKGQIDQNLEIFLRRYPDWTIPPKPINQPITDNSDNQLLFQYDMQQLQAKDVKNIMSMMYAFNYQTDDNICDNLILELDDKYFFFDDHISNAKSICQSSMYQVDMTQKNVSMLDWNHLTKNIAFKLRLTKTTFNSLFHYNSQNHIWSSLSEFIYITETDQQCKRRRTRSDSIQTEDVLNYIKEAEYGGRNYVELKRKFPDLSTLLTSLQNYMKEKTIYLVGLNNFHFVHIDYLRSWLIRIPSITDESDSHATNRKRKHSMSHNEVRKFFLPDFYRDECGEFKRVSFSEIVNRIYSHAHKNPGCTLQYLIQDLSIYIGVLVVSKIIQVMAEFKVLELRSLKKIGKCGLFSKRMTYEETEFNPYDNYNLTTVIVNPLSHLKMSHLLTDMNNYFNKLDH